MINLENFEELDSKKCEEIVKFYKHNFEHFNN